MKRMTKRICVITVFTALTLFMFTLTACRKMEFGVTDNTEKQMTIKAENADKDAFFSSGTLEVDEGEIIVVTSELNAGAIKVEIVREDEEQSIDKLPDLDGDPIMTVNCYGDKNKTETTSGEVPEGDYTIQATCLEKATGIIRVEVQ